MSDGVLRLIPTEPGWRPDDVALRRAVRVLRALAPDAHDVRAAVHDRVEFVDAGGDTERVDCPACGTELDRAWWADRLEHAAGRGFTDLAVTTPCCDTRTTLNDLRHARPAGFARAELTAVNPGRGWLTDEERARVAAALGHEVREVRTRG